ncbi:MAG: universal stress protein [Planctomycetales bacterium]|nr:universal stress protein [Planctomycetales bacterium]
MLKRILVGLGDLPHTLSATLRAIEIAQAHDAELTGVAMFDADRLDNSGAVPIGGGAAAKELKETRLETARAVIEAALALFIDKCDAAGVPYRIVHEAGDPLSGLAAYARYHDLMVCGLHGLFEHGVIDEPDDEFAKLVQEGVRPVVVVNRDHLPIRRTLIAYSGSMESAKTMKRFVQYRLWPDAKVRIVTFHNDAAIAEGRLAPAVDYCRSHGLDVDSEFVEALPQESLLPYANQWQADLIVMGNSAKSLLLRRILGETALNVMRKTNRPLFLDQ